MMSVSPVDVRQELKYRTRDAHDLVDRAYGRCRLEDRSDYSLFLLAKYRAYQSLDSYFAGKLPGTMRPPPMSDLIASDLALLDVRPDRRGCLDTSTLTEPLGAAYVVAGSHFGLKVMRRQWQRTRDPLVRSAGAYLSSDSIGSYWPTLRGLLDSDPPTKQRHINIVNSADSTFRLFLTALASARMELSALG